MRILISGSSGFVGSRLIQFLEDQRHSVVRLVRTSATTEREVLWTAEEGFSSSQEFDAIIHLAGESVNGRWTEAKKKEIYESRVYGTRMLAQSILKLKKLPTVFLCASAMGYYGDRDDEVLTESSTVGKGFLSDVCKDWESASQSLEARGVRTAQLRISVVLDPSGGALKQMIPIFKMGLGGRIGSGNQYISWISLDDLVRSVLFILCKKEISGPVNLSSPEPVRQRDFASTLAEVCRRPSILPMPRWLVKVLFGEMGESLLLASMNMASEKLIKSGFSFPGYFSSEDA